MEANAILVDATAFKAAVSAKSWKVGSIPTRFRKDCIMKYLVFCVEADFLTRQNSTNHQEAFLIIRSDAGELRCPDTALL